MDQVLKVHDGNDQEQPAVAAAHANLLLAESLVAVGYRETDTLDNGSAYYRDALRSYLDVILCYPPSSVVGRESLDAAMMVEDKILVLLVILGANTTTIHELFSHVLVESLRSQYYKPICIDQNVDQQLESFQDDSCIYYSLHDDALLCDDDPTLQILTLLMDMRCLLHYNNNSPTTLSQRDLHYKDFLETKEIPSLVNALKCHGKIHYLIHLRDSIPFTPRHAPELFRPIPIQQLEQVESQHHDPSPPPISLLVQPEFWMMIQDCFFLTPGLNDILHVFVSEEQYPAITVD